MYENYNPFKENRTEQMRDLWKYYVPFPGIEAAGKPLVVEGGRGSGKTMFFQCNSWKQNMLEIRKNAAPVTDIFDKKGFIGLYYRVDTTFVSSMKERKRNNWDAVFETYLSICILREILDFITSISKGMPICESELSDFSRFFSKKIYPNSKVESVSAFKQEISTYLDVIEDMINGIADSNSLNIRFVKAHRFISDLCIECGKLLKREEILFKIFIDEYETLQEYQQKIINTLIKHSELPVIFNIGLRPKGMKTPQTISETETIEAPHDYELVFLGVDKATYPDIIKDICRKRIVLGKEQGKIPNSASENIEDYLGYYEIDYEIKKIEQSTSPLSHIEKLNKLIKELGKKQDVTQENIEKYCRDLCENAPIVNSRLHYALLCKNTQYTPTLEELYNSYINKTCRYREWLHNRKNGVVYLLCKESKRKKCILDSMFSQPFLPI